VSRQPSPVREKEQMLQVLSGQHLHRELPSYWPKLVQYTYLRELGLTQNAAARAVGRSERTGQRWEAQENGELYLLARTSARLVWGAELDAAARRGLLQLLELDSSDPQLRALQLEAIKFHLERTNPEYAPSATRHEVAGEVKHAHLVGVVELPPMDEGVEGRRVERTVEQHEDSSKPSSYGADPLAAIELPPLDQGNR
jgi:DNA-binding XRE family transcriptional regulator